MHRQRRAPEPQRLAVFELEASGTQRNYGRLDALLEDLQMVSAGRADMAPGRAAPDRVGHAVVTVTYQGWAMNLKAGPGHAPPGQQVHRFPFNQIIPLRRRLLRCGRRRPVPAGRDADYGTPAGQDRLACAGQSWTSAIGR